MDLNNLYLQWRTERGGLGCSNPPPEIPKISVESSIAQAIRTGVSISFCSSLCSHTVVIY